jgi:hypothetical protein
MGHIRLGRLPATKRWQQVVSLLAQGAPLERIASASAEAAENSLAQANRDPALLRSFWLLTQIPLAARSPDFPTTLRSLGLEVSGSPSLIETINAFSAAIDEYVDQRGGRTDLGELAQHAATDSLAAVGGTELPSLFGATPEDARLAIGKLAAPARFAQLARDFFARLTYRHLDYYLSRELSNHVGPGQGIGSIDAHSTFNSALEQHCREASRIVETFAGGWFSKKTFEGGIGPEKARDFLFVALRKISRELKKRREDHG